MDSSLKNIITKGLGGLCIFATFRARDTGESLLLVGTFACLAVWLLTMNTENRQEDDELEK